MGCSRVISCPLKCPMIIVAAVAMTPRTTIALAAFLNISDSRLRIRYQAEMPRMMNAALA